MQNQSTNTAHSLYTLYETLSHETQQAFLQELLQNQHEKLENLAFYLTCKQAKDENEFLPELENTAFIDSLTDT